jgi:hypothetical protein
MVFVSDQGSIISIKIINAHNTIETKEVDHDMMITTGTTTTTEGIKLNVITVKIVAGRNSIVPTPQGLHETITTVAMRDADTMMITMYAIRGNMADVVTRLQSRVATESKKNTMKIVQPLLRVEDVMEGMSCRKAPTAPVMIRGVGEEDIIAEAGVEAETERIRNTSENEIVETKVVIADTRSIEKREGMIGSGVINEATTVLVVLDTEDGDSL